LSGLSIYFLVDKGQKRERKEYPSLQNNHNANSSDFDHNRNADHKTINVLNLIFIALYVLAILIVLTSKPHSITDELFISWEQIFSSPVLVIQLMAAILLSFFFPGYAFVYLLAKICPLKSLPKILLSFLLSMLIAGISVYVVEIMIGVPVVYLKPIIIGVDVLVLFLFVVYNKAKKMLSFDLHAVTSFFLQAASKFRIAVTTKNVGSFIVFASLLALVVFYTCYLENGVIVGDHWFHHGRSLLVSSGTFNDFSATGVGKYNPPFFPALLAGFFSLSGVPSVNAYVSVNLLNMMAIFAFYYFLSRWVPANNQKVAILATTLFVLSSGFGWVLVLDNTLTSGYYHSQESSLENLHLASIRSSDIRTPNTFINVGHPTFTTPLIIVALPAGFVLLGLIKEQINEKGRLRFISIMTAIVVLGIFSHPEFFLFIIVASIQILSFRMSQGNLVYASIMSALFICLIFDFLSPQNYNTATTILNIPLLILCLVFVSILWVLYRSRILSYLHRLRSANHSFHFTKIVNSISKNVGRIVIISVLAYIYVISFFVLEALSNDDIQIQVGTSTQRNIPWYLFPIKFGVVGLLGFAFILSYVFKRFEKETFVFAIIAAVALLAGPYYDEHRFSKYIMVAMIGFASIFVYKIILFLQRPINPGRQKHTAITTQLKPLVCSILIAAVVTSAGLSIFMLAGYKSLGYKSPEFQEDFFRVDFPSESDRNLLKFFGANLPDLATNFVAIQANDSQTTKIYSELQGFSAVPRIKILQNPQSLNSSTLEGLFYSLDNDNIKYIILVKTDIHLKQQLPGPFKFAFDNFERVYDSDTYIVLKVPDLSPPLSLSEGTADIGLVYNKRNDLPLLLRISNDTNNSNAVQYNYKFFNNIENSSELIVPEKRVNASGYESKNGETETLILHGDKKAKTLWSNVIKENANVNYVESTFRLIGENKTRNDFGIRIEDDINNQQYYVSFDGNWLKLVQRSNLEESDKELVLSQDPQMPQEQRGLWHSLKILVLKDTINIYLDDILKIKAIKYPFAENFSGISKIGITANKNIVQFEPLKIGYISDSAFESYQKTITREISNHLYYPVSALSLSKLRYETFLDGDLSVFSKKNVVLTSDPKLELEEGTKKEVEKYAYQFEERILKEKFDMYLDFVRSGGTIIVLNPDGNSSNYDDNSNKTEQGVFSKLLSLQYGKKVKFSGIFSDKEHNSIYEPQYDNFINISGLATDIEFSNSSDIAVKAYYVDLNNNDGLGKKIVAPFTIEKKYGAGKIILVNIAGYFDSIIKSNDREYLTLGDVPNMIGFDSQKQRMSAIDSQKQGMAPVDSTIFSGARIIGNMKISDHTGINIKSTSLLFNGFDDKAAEAEAAPSYNLTINKVSTSPYMPTKTNDSYYDNSRVQQNLNQNATPDENILLSNITIRDLEIYGPYEIIINSNDKPFHLSTASSYYDYAALAVPKGFDMLLKPSQGAYLQFTFISCPNNDNFCKKHVRISDSSNVFFHNVKADSQSISSLPILVKSPEIMMVNATVKFKLAPNINNLMQPSGNILAEGNIAYNFDHVETYDSYNNNGTKTDPLSYLKSLNLDGNYSKESQERDSLLLPGEISERAKDKRIEVPWQEAVLSPNGIITLISIIAVVTGVNYYLWPKIVYNNQLRR
jgi:hypothetical protein